mmetsp:Transcript_35348/g.53140  ORF Transcript_35348/g.53140 Transcript_35348/m.53140 type:complete len:411 (-) Transcript_35348:39-1271(-)
MIAGVRSERMGGGFLLAAGDVGALLQAGTAVQVFQQVEQGLLLALVRHSRILEPSLDGGHGDAGGQHGLAVEVLLDRLAQPVGSLSQSLERAGGGVETVVACVRLRLELEGLPGLEDGVAEGAAVGGLGIRAAQDLAAEVAPGEAGRVPLDLVEVDALARDGELGPHLRVEAVDDEDVVDLSAVEASSELDQVLALLQRVVLGAEIIHGASQLGGAVHEVVDHALGQSLVPRQAEGLLELVLGLLLDGQLVGLLLHGPGGDGAIMGVDEHVLVDGLGGDLALGLDADSLLREALGHQLLHAVSDSMRLDENERRVHTLGLEHLQLLDSLVQGSDVALALVGGDLALCGPEGERRRGGAEGGGPESPARAAAAGLSLDHSARESAGTFPKASSRERSGAHLVDNTVAKKNI